MLPKLSGPVIERDYGAEPEGVAEKETVMEMEVSAPQFLAGFKCAPAAEGDAYMRAAILGDMASDILLGESSPLYQRLYEQGLINPSFGGAYEMMPGVAYLYAGGDSKDAGAVTDAILQEAARIAADGRYGLRTEGLFLLRLGQFEFGESRAEQDVVPHEDLLHVRHMHAVAVVVGQYLRESGLQLLGSLLVADRLLAARVVINIGEHVGQRQVVALGEDRYLRQGTHLRLSLIHI